MKNITDITFFKTKNYAVFHIYYYAFISLENKVGMAIGTSALAGVLGNFGYAAISSRIWL